jgi:hypothetical protein
MQMPERTIIRLQVVKAYIGSLTGAQSDALIIALGLQNVQGNLRIKRDAIAIEVGIRL